MKLSSLCARTLAPLGAFALAMGLAQQARAAYVVTNTNDSGEGSLRQAIAKSNVDQSDNRIIFDPEVFGSSKRTIVASSPFPQLLRPLFVEGPTTQGAGVTIRFTSSGNYAFTNQEALALSNITFDGTGQSNGLCATIGSDAPPVTLRNCTVRNCASISLGETMILRNSTVFGVQDIVFNGPDSLTLDSCTFTNDGRIVANQGSAPLNISNTIIAGFTSSEITPTSGDHNIIVGSAAEAGLQVTDDNITVLADNGGPTPTVALATGSKALDTGSTKQTTDQRGLTRPFGKAPDIGAFEAQDSSQSGSNFVVNTPDDHNDGFCGVADCTLREAVRAANLDTDTNAITFDPTVFATRQTIALNGPPSIRSDLSITAPAVGLVLTSASSSSSAILQGEAGRVSLSGLTFNGDAPAGSTNIANASYDLYLPGPSTINGCTFTGRSTSAFLSTGDAKVLNNCTFFGTAVGITNYATSITADSCTFVGNTMAFRLEAGTANANNCLVVGNGTDISGGRPLTSSTSNYFSPTTSGIADPNGLADNGGPTQTVALVGGSPAINAGSTKLTTDQRGRTRPYISEQANTPDIGAFEVQNTVPTIDSVTITPNPAYTNSLLTANVRAVDGAGNALTFAYTWKKNGTVLSGETGETLDLSKADNGDKGDVITVTVTVSDGREAGTLSKTSAPLTISNDLVTISSITLRPNTPRSADTITADIRVANPNGGRPNLTYTWNKTYNGSTRTILTTRTTSTQDKYDLSKPTYGNKGDIIILKVTVDDGNGGTSSLSKSLVVGNTVPVVTDLRLSSTAPTTKTLLRSYVTTSDIDATERVDTLTTTYQWRIAGRFLPDESTSNLDLSKYTFAKAGDAVTLSVRVSDGTALSASRTVTATIGGSTPKGTDSAGGA